MALPDDIDSFILGYTRAFNDRDFESVESLYADDATLEDPVDSGLVRGRANIRAFYEQYRNQPSFLHYSGDRRVSVSSICFSFFAYIGEGADLAVVRITDSFRFDDAGKIVEMRAYWGEGDVGGVVPDGAAQGRRLRPSPAG